MDHCPAGELQPIEVIVVHHLRDLLDAQDFLVPLEGDVLVADVVGDVVDGLEADVVSNESHVQFSSGLFGLDVQDFGLSVQRHDRDGVRYFVVTDIGPGADWLDFKQALEVGEQD